MRLFNYLLLFLSLLPLFEYATIESDLIQLVVIFEDIDSSFVDSSLASKEYFLDLRTKINTAHANNNYKEVIALIAEYARGKDKPGFDEELLTDIYLDEFFPAASLGLLTHYNNEFGALSISNENVDSIIERIVDFFGIDKNLPEQEKLNQISAHYLRSLTALRTSPDYEDDIKTIDYPKNVKNIVEIFKIKGLTSSPQYEKLAKEIPKHPLESPGYYTSFTG